MTEAKHIKDLSKEEILGLLKDAALNRLAHNGLWFQAGEGKHGLEAAMEPDKVGREFTLKL